MDYGELKQNCSLITLNEDSKIYTAGKLADSFGNIINGQEVITSSFVNGIYLPNVQVEPDYLRFTAEADNSSVRFCHYWSGATIWTGSCPIEYSIDNCSTWNDYGKIQSHSGTIINLNSGDTVYFRNKNSKRYGVINNGASSSSGNNVQFKLTGKLRADGNIMSLIDKDCICTCLGYYAFTYFFSGCTALTKAPEMPATSMGTYAYYYMYKACTSLKTAPKILPVKSVATSAYEGMFYGCTNLETGPLINGSFFQTSYSLRNMFYNCQKLKKLGLMMLSAPSTANTSNWLYGTTGSSVTGRTIYLASGTTWNPASSVHGVPSNWTKIYI